MYDEKTGKRIQRGGRPVPRGKSPTPCWSCPKGSPEQETERTLSGKNWAAWWYYQRAAAPLGERLPADAIVHRNHAIIRQVIENSERVAAATQVELASMRLTRKS